MILSVSRRTDIPCRYSEWFMNRIREGSAVVRNPFNAGQLGRIPMTPEAVDCIVFWTKDPQPLIPYLKELDNRGYRLRLRPMAKHWNRACGIKRKLSAPSAAWQNRLEAAGLSGAMILLL